MFSAIKKTPPIKAEFSLTNVVTFDSKYAKQVSILTEG